MAYVTTHGDWRGPICFRWSRGLSSVSSCWPRSVAFGVLPDAAVAPLLKATTLLTIVSMAALGLGVDLRVISQVGSQVTAAATLSLLLLLIISLWISRMFS